MSDSSSEDEIQNLRSDKKCEVSDNLENGAIKRIDTGDGVENKTFEMLVSFNFFFFPFTSYL